MQLIAGVVLLLLSGCLTSDQEIEVYNRRFVNHQFKHGDIVVSRLDPTDKYIIVKVKNRHYWSDSMVPEYECVDKNDWTITRSEIQLTLSH